MGFVTRFGVSAADGRRSSIWRVWADRGKSDIYVAMRSVAGIVKVSLHQSGDCNASMTQQAAENNPAVVERLGGVRHMGQWRRQTGIGATHVDAFWITFPESELRVLGPEKGRSRETLWIPPPAVRMSINVACAFTGPLRNPDDWPGKSMGGTLLSSAGLANGEVFWLIYFLHPTLPKVPGEIAMNRRAFASSIRLHPRGRLLVLASSPGRQWTFIDAAGE